MVEKSQIKSVLDRLTQVEADMGDPAVLADAKRTDTPFFISQNWV